MLILICCEQLLAGHGIILFLGVYIMTYAQGLKKGTSSCFIGEVSQENFNLLATAGISCLEISGKMPFYEKIDFVSHPEILAERAKAAGITLWSVHLPFSKKHDISSEVKENRDLAIKLNRDIIEAAGRIGIKVAVLHPSAEPITDEDRPRRLALSREAIIYLREVADSVGMVLAVENLPRTCLCNKAEEMIALLEGTGATVVFDTNHSLIQDNVSFLDELIDAGIRISSLHISDYDFIDERHRLPGDGINNWNGILSCLERAGYTGPLMYEVSSCPKERDAISIDGLTQNMDDLAAGRL